MILQSEGKALSRRSLVVALGVAALAASGMTSTVLAQGRDGGRDGGRDRDRDRTQDCDLMSDDCLMEQLQDRDRRRLRDCDPSRQDCQALRRELRAQVEEQWRRGGGRGNR